MYKTSKELFKSEYVSYSRLSCYEQCPRQFKLRYLEGIPCPVGKAAQLGKAVHAIIASFLNDVGPDKTTICLDISDLREYTIPVCQELRQEGELTVFLNEYEIDPLLEGLVSLLPKIDYRSIVSIESETNFEVGEYKFKVITDLILRNSKGKFTVIDWKTGKPEYVDDSQIQMYALPLFEDTSISEIELIYAFLKYGDMRRFRMVDEFINRVQRIEDDNNFLPKPSFLCRFCGVSNHCPEG